MTARQPPGEKGAKACTIGCDSSRDEYFCAYFSGELTEKESKCMKNGARYVVTTHWGTFSLDEGAYQDYLAGKLWICWTPGKSTQPQNTTSGYFPPMLLIEPSLFESRPIKQVCLLRSTSWASTMPSSRIVAVSQICASTR